MTRRLRTLIVSYELSQSGAELFTYNVARSLDSKRFDVQIATRWRPNDRQYYAQRLASEGFVIHRPSWFALLVRDRMARFRGTRLRRVAVRLFSHFDRGLRRLIRRADLVLISQIENYTAVQEHLSGKAAVLHLMSNRLQYDFDVYAECDPRRHPGIVMIDPEQRNGIRGTPLESGPRTLVTLSIDAKSREAVYDASRRSRDPIRIGVFQRLHRQERPFIPLLEALRQLRGSVAAELHVYGRGNPEIFGPELDALGVRDYVHFEPHAVDLREPLRNAGLSLTWMTTYGATLGYASVEIASYGVPIVFWNCGNHPYHEVRAASAGAYTAYDSVPDLVAETLELLRSDAALQECGARLQSHIRDRYDLSTMMATLEPFYAMVSAQVRA